MGKIALGAAVTVAVISLAGNYLLYTRYSSHRPLIDVNNQVIRRKDLDDRLDYLYSNNILKGMILNDLVLQTAAKDNCLPSPKDISDTKASIQRTRPTLISQAQQTDPNLSLFNQQLEVQLALRNLQIRGVKVDDADVTNFYSTHKAEFLLPAQTSSTVVLAKDQVAADTAAMMLKSGTSTTVIAGQPGLAVVGINAHQVPPLPKDVLAQVLAMRTGDIKTFDAGPFKVVIRATAVNSQGVPPLELIRDQVEIAAKLAKAPTQKTVLEELVHNAHIVVESDRYAGSVPQAAAQPTATQ